MKNLFKKQYFVKHKKYMKFSALSNIFEKIQINFKKYIDK